jgi:hypothetical protein
MSSEPIVPRKTDASLELPVEELLRRARPFPSLAELAIEDLDEEEGEAFLEAIRS